MLLLTDSATMEENPFHYDYDTLRTTGVILAVVMFISGIVIHFFQQQPKLISQMCLASSG
uniref:FXYD domain-containing ion transport regulator n=1 Tax=Erpetoichthys calabaricus TaxID=27687 RepID=A0A8C4T6U9_ERPCA